MSFKEILVLLACSFSTNLACTNDTFTTPFGTWASPNYPEKYPSNQDCYATVVVPENTQMVLLFTEIEMETYCGYDYIELHPVLGASPSDKVTYCGNKTPSPLISKTNHITIHFHSDGYTNYKGFKLEWKTLDNFVYYNTSMTWLEASDVCSREGGALIRNDDVTMAQIAHVKKDKPEFTDVESWTNEYFTPWVWFKGCLEVLQDSMNGNTTRFKDNQMKVCLIHCSTSNYFALQDEECICLDDYTGTFVKPVTYCRAACPGNKDEKCGGHHLKYYTVYMNDICFNNSTQWLGIVSQSIGGKRCDPWTDHYNASSDQMFADGSVADASNYCRDPNGDSLLWCFSGGFIQYCDVPKCFAKDIQQDSPTPCLEFEFLHGVISTKQVDCSTSYRYLFLESQRQSSSERYDIRPSISWYNWDLGWRLLTSGRTYHTATLFQTDHTGGPYWRGITRSRVHSSFLAPSHTPIDCYKARFTDSAVEESATRCLAKAPFICQHVIVNCGGSSTGENGTISSPNFPNAYVGLLHCVWKINVTSGYFISMQIQIDLETSHECQNDVLKVFDGNTTQDAELGAWCGYDTFTVNSTENQVVLTFRTDKTINYKGFKVEWHSVAIPTTPVSTTIEATMTQTITTQTNLKSSPKSDPRTITNNDADSDSVLLYAVIAAVALLLVILLVVIFLVRRYRARKTEKHTDVQVHCTIARGSKPELVVTNTTLRRHDTPEDAVYNNTDVQVCDELYLNCNGAGIINTIDNNDNVNKTEDDSVYSSVNKQGPAYIKDIVGDETVDIYDHTNNSPKLGHQSRQNDAKAGDTYSDTYDHTSTLQRGNNNAFESSTYSVANQVRTEENTYDHTLTLQRGNNNAFESSTYSVANQVRTEENTYDHTLTSNGVYKDDNYNRLDTESGEHVYNKSNEMILHGRNNAAFEDSTYSTVNKLTTVEGTYDSTLPRNGTHIDDTYNRFDQDSAEHVYDKSNSGTLQRKKFTESIESNYSTVNKSGVAQPTHHDTLP